MKKNNWKFLIVQLSFILSSVTLSFASGRTSAGLSLLESPSSRSASLANAFSVVPDDSSAQNFNPATLATLKGTQLTSLYQKGVFDDSYMHLTGGIKTSRGGVGFSAGYYDGGETDGFDGVQLKKVTAQKDQVLSIGYSHQVGRLKIGFSPKYFTSEIADTVSASAWAMDIGSIYSISKRISMGVSYQNLGSKLKYDIQENDLPRILRLGSSFVFADKNYPTFINIDIPYETQTKKAPTLVGVESNIGILALRLGYKSNSSLEGFTFGSGFTFWRKLSLDYAFGFVDEFDSRHHISLRYKLGEDQ